MVELCELRHIIRSQVTFESNNDKNWPLIDQDIERGNAELGYHGWIAVISPVICQGARNSPWVVPGGEKDFEQKVL